MVYRSQESASPPPRELSRSPPPEVSAQNRPGPSKRVKLTDADRRRIEVEKLLSNPDRQVALPQPTKEKQLRAPQELVRNVQSTASAAGSGEFHVYKHARRREAERLKIIDDRAQALEEQAAFQARQAARDAEAEAKTAKNRAKRQKRKGGGAGNGKQGQDGGGDGKGNGNGDGGKQPTRKLAGGAVGFVPRRNEEDVVGHSEGTGVNGSNGDGAGGVSEGTAQHETTAGATASTTTSGNIPTAPKPIETTVVIHDDD